MAIQCTPKVRPKYSTQVSKTNHAMLMDLLQKR
jgi:hypothetical protein